MKNIIDYIEKYGPVIKTVNFDIENALSNGVNN